MVQSKSTIQTLSLLDDEDNTDDQEEGSNKSYEYITSMPLFSLTDEKINELNNKHNLSSFSENDIKKNYDKILREREQYIEIPKENIVDRNDFNSKFEKRLQ